MKTYLNFLIILFVVAFTNDSTAQKTTLESINAKNKSYGNLNQEWIPSKKALGGNVFIGTGILDGNISEFFSNNYFIGINVDIHRNRFVFQIDDYIGFGTTKKDLEFNTDQKWEKNKVALSFMFGLNVGYSIIDNKNLKVVPLAGIGVNLLSSKFLAVSEFSEHEPFLPIYKIGMYIDFKSLVLLQDRVRINNEDKYYASLRLSFGITNNIGTPKLSQFYQGSLFYITIGMGGLSRDFEKN